MSDISNTIDIILDDIRVELSDEFDRNFERKGFFNEKWQPVKKDPKKGSLMLRTSFLRNSIQSSRQGFRLVWRSSAPYASVHNDGGTIKMPARKQVLHFNKKGRFAKNNKRASYGQKASVGAYTVTMPKRQFIGTSPETDKIITEIVDEHLPRSINQFLTDLFNQGNG